MSILLTLAGMLVDTAIAQGPPPAPCIPGVPGCGGPSNILVTSLIPNIVGFMLRIVGALSVAMIVWYGLRMVTNRGDDTEFSKARWGIIYAMLGIGVASVAQIFVSFVVTEQYVFNPMDVGIELIRNGVRIMLNVTNATFAAMLVYYGILMVISQGKTEEYGKARSAVMYTIIGALFVNLAHTLVRLVASFFGV